MRATGSYPSPRSVFRDFIGMSVVANVFLDPEPVFPLSTDLRNFCKYIDFPETLGIAFFRR